MTEATFHTSDQRMNVLTTNFPKYTFYHMVVYMITSHYLHNLPPRMPSFGVYKNLVGDPRQDPITGDSCEMEVRRFVCFGC